MHAAVNQASKHCIDQYPSNGCFMYDFNTYDLQAIVVAMQAPTLYSCLGQQPEKLADELLADETLINQNQPATRGSRGALKSSHAQPRYGPDSAATGKKHGSLDKPFVDC